MISLLRVFTLSKGPVDLTVTNCSEFRVLASKQTRGPDEIGEDTVIENYIQISQDWLRNLYNEAFWVIMNILKLLEKE